VLKRGIVRLAGGNTGRPLRGLRRRIAMTALTLVPGGLLGAVGRWRQPG